MGKLVAMPDASLMRLGLAGVDGGVYESKINGEPSAAVYFLQDGG